MRHRVLLVGGLDSRAEQRLSAGADVVRAQADDEETLAAAIVDADALVVRTNVRVTRAILAAGRRLRVVGVAGVGTDKVDMAAANELGIVVLNRPGAATDAVAEFTIALMLNLLRPMARLMDQYRAGGFRAARAAAHGVELRTLTVGIVGMGRIGSAVGRILTNGFGASVLYNDIIDVGPFDFDARRVDKPAIWSQCDIITLHVPLTDLTYRLVDEGVLRQMRPGAFLINAARGAVVDTDALVRALREGWIAGAGLDVTDPEPLAADHPLFAIENCLTMPHAAARTHGGIERMYAVVDDVLAFLQSDRPESRG